MASTKQYTVLHPIRHDGYLYSRGAGIKLSEKDAERLLDRGVITPGAPEAVVAGPTPAEVLAFAAKINALKNAELIEFAKAEYDLELAGDDKREALIAALHTRYVGTLAVV